jgi:hypothetical protein
VTAIAMAVLLAGNVFDPFDLLLAGRTGPSAALIEKDFSQPFEYRGAGFDGQQTYAIARMFPDLEGTQAYLDVPRYRLMRILQPALASPAGRGTPLVLALLGLSIVGLGLLSGSVADLADRHGRSPVVGYLAVIPALAPTIVLTVEPLAYGLAFVGVALADRRRFLPAAALFCLAALTRETAVVVAAAVAAGLLLSGQIRGAFVVGLPPAVVTAAWFLFLGTQVDPAWPHMTEALGLLYVPPSRIALGVAVFAISLAGAWWWRRTPVMWPIGYVFAVWVLIDKPDIVEWLSLPRVSIPGLALGLCGPALGRHRARGRDLPDDHDERSEAGDAREPDERRGVAR